MTFSPEKRFFPLAVLRRAAARASWASTKAGFAPLAKPDKWMALHSQLRHEEPWWAKASVDVELVALGVLHPHRVVIEAVGAQGTGGRGPEIRQPPGLGVDSLHAGGE
jgi:hypothetical protein